MELHSSAQTIKVSTGTIFKAICIVVMFWIAFLLKDLILVVLLSVVIASSIEPATKWLVKKRFPRVVAVIIIYLILIALVSSTLYFLLIPLLSESSSVIRNLPTYLNSGAIAKVLGQGSFLSGVASTVNINRVVEQINLIIQNISGGALSTVTTIFGGIMSFLITVVLSFYLSVDEDGVGKFLKVIAPIKHEAYIIDLWRRAQHKIGLWMQGQIILAVIIGVLVFLGLTLLRVPNALLLSFLAAALEIIPLFGPILAAVPAVMIAMVSGGGLSMVVSVIILYIIIHQFENQLIYPLVVKQIVGVSPVVSIIALAAGFKLAGFLGLVISVPLITALMEFFNDLEKNKVEATERRLLNNNI